MPKVSVPQLVESSEHRYDFRSQQMVGFDVVLHLPECVIVSLGRWYFIFATDSIASKMFEQASRSRRGRSS